MIPRAVPRFPGPKTSWTAFGQVSGATNFLLFGFATSGFDYWIEQIDVVELTTGGTTSSFNMYFHATAVGGSPIKYFFGNQVSPNTGLYFPYRGLIRLDADLYFQSQSGTWGVYVQGFITPNVNEST